MAGTGILETIAGFFDGDGSIELPEPKIRDKNPCPRLTFRQSYNSGEPPELKLIKEMYGGNLYLTSKRHGNSRDSWSLIISSTEEAKKILEDLHVHCALKKEQVDLALSYLADRSDPEEVYLKFQKMKCEYGNAIIHQDRITDAYIAGLFMADGSVGIYTRGDGLGVFITSCIAKKQCPPLLVAIQKYLEFGRVVKRGVIEFSQNNTLALLERLRDYVHGQKRPQINLVLDEYAPLRRGKKRTADQMTEQEIARKLKEFKKK